MEQLFILALIPLNQIIFPNGFPPIRIHSAVTLSPDLISLPFFNP